MEGDDARTVSMASLEEAYRCGLVADLRLAAERIELLEAISVRGRSLRALLLAAAEAL